MASLRKWRSSGTRHKPIPSGSKFGRWTVLEFFERQTHKSKTPRVFYRCQCECGTIKNIRADRLRYARPDHGCAHCARHAFNDLTGKKFGKLTVIERVKKPDGARYQGSHWRCLCECGQEITKSADLLEGCVAPHCGCSPWREADDLTGQEFGSLSVLRLDHKSKKGHVWLCRCECGKEIPVYHYSLTGNNTKSCGCKWSQWNDERRAKLLADFDQSSLVGKVLGVLTVKEVVAVNLRGNWTALCMCECGTETTLQQSWWERGEKRSCGCKIGMTLRNVAPVEEKPRRVWQAHNRTHGLTGSAEYRIWRNMITRCTNQNSASFEYYGKKGITVCERWLKFENFIEDVGPRPSQDHSLEREDGKKGYEPANCSWKTRQEQGWNKSNGFMIEYGGETKCLAQWCHELDLPYATIAARLARGRSAEDAFETPIKNKSHTKRDGNELSIWTGIRSRCHREEDSDYQFYGARGIKMCDRWRESFEAFLEDMGPRPSPLHSVDRFPDQNGNYEKSNCRWATTKQQSNNRSTNVWIEFNGERKTLSEWADASGIPYATFRARIMAGWSMQDATGTPTLLRGQTRSGARLL